jgi:hypothetical protein
MEVTMAHTKAELEADLEAAHQGIHQAMKQEQEAFLGYCGAKEYRRKLEEGAAKVRYALKKLETEEPAGVITSAHMEAPSDGRSAPEEALRRG